jgi:hypothetical protein
VLRDGVHQRRDAALDRGDGAVERAADVGRVLDRPFRMPAEAARDGREIGRRVEYVHADMSPLHRRAALPGNRDLMLPVIIIGAVVMHDAQERHLVLGGEPQRADVEHQVAVGLAVDHQPSRAAMGERDAGRHADLGAGAKRPARPTIGAVEAP